MKKIIRWIVISLLALGLVLGALHYWLVFHAEQLISDAVRRESNGTVLLDIDNINYHYRTRQLLVKDAHLYSAPNDTLTTSYRFRIPEIRMRLVSLRQLLFHRKLSINNLYIPSPIIEVTRKKRKNRKKDVSLSTEMGRVYNGIRQALQKLQIRQMELVNGSFILNDQSRSPQTITSIGDIYFRIDNLLISDSTAPGNESNQIFAEDLEFRTRNQQFVLPGGKQQLGFASFSINMRKQQISIDSFFIQSLASADSSNLIQAAFDSIRLINIDFKALYNDERISADSVYCSNPDLQLHLLNASSGKTPFSMRKLIADIGTDMDLRYVGLQDASLRLRTGSDDNEISFRGNNRLLEIQGLRINPESVNPLQVDNFILEAENYESYSPDSSYQIRLSSLGLEDSTLRMENVRITSYLLKPGKAYRDHHFPLVTLNGIDWQTLLFNRKIVANEVRLYNPEVFYNKRSKNPNSRLRIYDAFDAVNELVTVGNIRVENGQFHFSLLGNTKLDFLGVTGGIEGNQLLLASNTREVEESLETLHIDETTVEAGDWRLHLKDANFDDADALFKGRELRIRNRQNSFSAEARNFSVESFRLEDSSNLLQIGTIQWEDAVVTVDAHRDFGEKNQVKKKIGIQIEAVKGINTQLHIALSEEAFIGTNVRNINIGNLHLPDGQFSKSDIPDMLLEGDSIYFQHPDMQFSAENYASRSNGKMQVTNPAFHFSSPALKMDASLQRIAISGADGLFRNQTIQLDSLILDHPRVSVYLDSLLPEKEKKASSFNGRNIVVNEMIWNAPQVHVYKETAAGQIAVHQQKGEKESTWVLSGFAVNSERNGISVNSLKLSDSLHLHLAGRTEPSFRLNTRLHIEDISLPFGKEDQVSLSLKEMFIPRLDIPGADSLYFTDVRIRNEHFGEALRQPQLSGLLKSAGWDIQAKSGTWNNNREKLQWWGAGYHSGQKVVSVDSFRFTPLISREDFFRQQVFETDYITAAGGRTSIHHLDFADSVWTADTVSISHPRISAYRDKRLPFQHGNNKSLPTEVLENLGIPLRIARLDVDSMQIHYGEWNDKTDKEGNVYLDILKAQLRHISSIPEYGDSLLVEAKGNFMRDIPFTVNIEQAYLDSLRNMHIYLLAGPGALTGLNEILPPLASLYVKSGRFSQLKMDVEANKNTASGEMLVRYQNLHLRILKKGNLEKKGFLASIATFFADQFLLKHSNQFRTAVFAHERDKEKSVFNYMVKIIIKGLATNTGILKNKKKKK